MTRSLVVCGVLLLGLCLFSPAYSQRNWGPDTVNGIAWGPLTRLSFDTYLAHTPTIAVQGETVHITWENSGLRYPYRRSTDGGLTFEPTREIAPDSLYVGRCWIVSGGRRLHAFFYGIGAVNDTKIYHMYSDDRGDTWSVPYSLPEESGGLYAVAAYGDTAAVVVTLRTRPFWCVIVSGDGGESWTVRENYLFWANNPTLAITPGAIHLVKGWIFDSAGYWSEYVAQYRRSTDLGLTWSDSIPLSTVKHSEDYEPYVSADTDGGEDSSRLFAAWTDIKYGCYSMGGCAILGRLSTDNGRTFGPEMRFDQRPAGAWANTRAREKLLTVAWSDDYQEGMPHTFITTSTDNGQSWTQPYLVADTAGIPQVAVTGGGRIIHVVMEKNLGMPVIEHRWQAFYRRGEVLEGLTGVDLQAEVGWNLWALPMDLPTGKRRSQVYPFSASPAFIFNSRGGYVETDTLLRHRGYWIKFDSWFRRFTYRGRARCTDTIPLQKGWNMVGTYAGVPLPAPGTEAGWSTIPSGATMPSMFYGFDPSQGYTPASVLMPGKGYWVKAEDSCLLVYDSNVSTAVAGNTVLKQHPSVLLQTFSTLRFTNSTGQERVLYLAGSGETTAGMRESFDARFLLPPKGPDGIFDCRFGSGGQVAFSPMEEEGTSKRIPIEITGTTYPLTLRWQMKDDHSSVFLVIDGYSIALKGEGTTTLPRPAEEIFIRFGGTPHQGPKEFALYQNYPNPFNPTTRIRYDVPYRGKVEMKVFDLFGREVARLIDQEMEPGEYTIEWNGENFASGVYLYRLLWQDNQGRARILSGKMALIR